MTQLRVEIWSDVVCPWCYVGKRRFEAALAQFEQRDDVALRWRSFELDPAAPPVAELAGPERLAAKYGVSLEQAREMNANVTRIAAAEGLEYDLDRARSGNTFDAHRLIQLGADAGIQDAVKERLMRGYFTEVEPIGDHDALARLGADAGLDPDAARALLAGDGHADSVRADEQLARQLGITAVPFFVLDRRYGVSGAQPAEILLGALQQAWQDARSAIEA